LPRAGGRRRAAVRRRRGSRAGGCAVPRRAATCAVTTFDIRRHPTAQLSSGIRPSGRRTAMRRREGWWPRHLSLGRGRPSAYSWHRSQLSEGRWGTSGSSPLTLIGRAPIAPGVHRRRRRLTNRHGAVSSRGPACSRRQPSAAVCGRTCGPISAIYGKQISVYGRPFIAYIRAYKQHK
jgi:hypothetical protein